MPVCQKCMCTMVTFFPCKDCGKKWDGNLFSNLPTPGNGISSTVFVSHAGNTPDVLKTVEQRCI